MAQQPQLTLPIGHTSVIISAIFTPNGKWVITASEDNTAKIWEAASGKLFFNLKCGGIVNSIDISSDGKWVITSSDDSTARIWEIISGKLFHILKGHRNSVLSAQFSQDGKWVITNSFDSTARIWETLTGKLFRKIRGNIQSADFSSDGKWILTTSFEAATAKLFEFNSGKLFCVLKGHTNEIESAKFSPDGKWIATTSIEGDVKIWGIPNGKLIYTLQDTVNSVQFSPDGKWMVSTSSIDPIKIWETENGKLTYALKDSAEIVQFSQDGKWIITSSSTGTHIWDVATGKLIYFYILNFDRENILYNVAKLNPDGTLILTSFDNSAQLWETSTGKLIHTMEGHTIFHESAQFSPDGKLILALSEDDSIALLESSSGKLLYTRKQFSLEFTVKQLSPNGKWLITFSRDSLIKLYEIATGKLANSLQPKTSDYVSGQFSPNDKYILSAPTLLSNSNNKEVQIWETATGKLMYTLDHKEEITTAEFSPDGKFVLTSSRFTCKIWEITTGELLYTINDNLMRLPQFSPDSKWVMTASLDLHSKHPTGFCFINIWNVETGKLVQTLKTHSLDIESAQFNPEGKRVLTISSDYLIGTTLKMWDIPTAKVLYTLSVQGHYFESAEYSPEGKWILAITRAIDPTLNEEDYPEYKIFEAATGKLLNTRYSKEVDFAQFSQDGRRVLTTSWKDNKVARIWETSSGKLLYILKGHTDEIMSAQFSPDGKWVVTASKDNTIKIWDALNGQLLYTYFAINTTDYVVQIPSGYYMTTKAAAKTFYYVTKDLKVITFEQLDVKYNRPDKVLETIGKSDTALIHSYRNAYYKRIERLNIDTTAFRNDYSVPVADITNREKIDTQQTKSNLTLHIVGKDDKYKLDRFNVWVNEVPVFGIKGRSIRDQNKDSLDTTVTIMLSQGENRIETSVFNANATESYRSPLKVNYLPASPVKDTLYFIGIGVNQYKNDTSRNLSFAAKDIRDLDNLFSEGKKIAVVSRIFIDSLVTKENILDVKNLLMRTGINDKVIIALSGHGVLYKQKDFYFGTYDIDFDNPDKRGFKYEELESLLDDIPARKKLLLIDACHSGEVDTSVSIQNVSKIQIPPVRHPEDSTKINKGDPDEEIKTSLGLDNSFELMKELFTDLSRSNGAVVISAARGRGTAEEGQAWNNGAFTLCFKAAFLGNDRFPELKETADKNGDGVSINELKEYILTKVPLLTKDRQKPTTRRENIEVDWKLW